MIKNSHAQYLAEKQASDESTFNPQTFSEAFSYSLPSNII